MEGKTVRLELDVQERDRYGHLLAYVYVDDVMVNPQLVADGFAQVMTVPPNVKYQDLFLKLHFSVRPGYSNSDSGRTRHSLPRHQARPPAADS